ncbi:MULTISPECIES: AraC family transcriptional regulator [Paenibacillus]|uniref:AraC family transcriptional regulator n=1 Tax=Paenibacillus TaxID=44249 RepID=UPI00115FB98A|nr:MULTISPECIES: AraC family transcriptional regulator [Paenibacillus]MCL6662374.1 AraC family transcriptional regulator [Paenibacillus amylolyticus]
MQWIEEHFKYEIRLDQMAADVHLSKSYAYRIFIKTQVAALRNTSKLECAVCLLAP